MNPSTLVLWDMWLAGVFDISTLSCETSSDLSTMYMEKSSVQDIAKLVTGTTNSLGHSAISIPETKSK